MNLKYSPVKYSVDLNRLADEDGSIWSYILEHTDVYNEPICHIQFFVKMNTWRAGFVFVTMATMDELK